MRSGYDRIGRGVSEQQARRQCLDKRRFESRNAARDTAARNLERFGKLAATFVYKCTLCHGWHLTRKPTVHRDTPQERRRA